MKTTVEIPDALFREAKLFAAKHGLSLREVFERGLRGAMHGPLPSRRPFRLKTVITRGEEMACEENWETIRSLIYEGHGG